MKKIVLAAIFTLCCLFSLQAEESDPYITKILHIDRENNLIYISNNTIWHYKEADDRSWEEGDLIAFSRPWRYFSWKLNNVSKKKGNSVISIEPVNFEENLPHVVYVSTLKGIVILSDGSIWKDNAPVLTRLLDWQEKHKVMVSVTRSSNPADIHFKLINVSRGGCTKPFSADCLGAQLIGFEDEDDFED